VRIWWFTVAFAQIISTGAVQRAFRLRTCTAAFFRFANAFCGGDQLLKKLIVAIIVCCHFTGVF
jgi:hypothetical protein